MSDAKARPTAQFELCRHDIQRHRCEHCLREDLEAERAAHASEVEALRKELTEARERTREWKDAYGKLRNRAAERAARLERIAGMIPPVPTSPEQWRVIAMNMHTIALDAAPEAQQRIAITPDMVRGLVRAAEMIEQRDGGRVWDDEVSRALKEARERGWGCNKIGTVTANAAPEAGAKRWRDGQIVNPCPVHSPSYCEPDCKHRPPVEPAHPYALPPDLVALARECYLDAPAPPDLITGHGATDVRVVPVKEAAPGFCCAEGRKWFNVVTNALGGDGPCLVYNCPTHGYQDAPAPPPGEPGKGQP